MMSPMFSFSDRLLSPYISGGWFSSNIHRLNEYVITNEVNEFRIISTASFDM